MTVRPIKIFCCYAHEDDTLRKQLATHLSPLRRLRNITGWFDRDIQAGAEWKRESKEQLDAANIILLLISADFMASDYCYTVEMTRALERQKAGTAYVIPILLRPVEWERTPLGVLSPLPTNRVPVTQWTNPDAAWLNVVQGISKIVRKLLPKQLLSLQDTDILYTEQGPLSGQTIGEKYLLGALVGEGGFSQVYKAQHLLIQRKQAVKVLLERHFRKQEFRNRFLREAKTVASLDHPHIIHLDDFGAEASRAYLVMPFMSGGTLQDILDKQQGFLEQDQVVSYLEDICAALDYSHDRGVIHLDLKPQNLLVHENGRLLLSDFGVAHLMKQGAIEGGTSLRVGTPHYMAPEHIKGSPERLSDLFSLGVILYQMLVGRLPFDGLPLETVLFKNMTEWPPAPRVLRPELSQAVQEILKRALAKQPDQRYKTANELLVAFKKALPPSTQPRSSVLQLELSSRMERSILIGTLEQFHLSQVLQRIELHEKTGLLEVRQGAQWIEFYFRDGRLICIGPMGTRKSLIDRLLQDEIISQQTYLEVKRILGNDKQSETRIALTLIERGYVTHEELRAWAIKKALAVLSTTLAWTTGEIYFKEGTQPPSDCLLVAIPITSLIETVQWPNLLPTLEIAGYPNANQQNILAGNDLTIERITMLASNDPEPVKVINIFILYVEDDEKYMKELQKHLKAMQNQYLKQNYKIVIWHSSEVIPGQDWKKKIEQQLAQAHIILLLVSIKFINSQLCRTIQIQLALKRHEDGKAWVIPVILSPCDWTGEEFGHLEPLPSRSMPIIKWRIKEEAYVDVIKGIRRAIDLSP